MEGFKHSRDQWGLPGGSTVKNLLALKEMQETWVQSLGWEESPGGGNTSPLQYSRPGEPHGQRRLAGYSP